LHDAQVDELSGCDPATLEHDRPLALPDTAVNAAKLIQSLDEDLHVAADPARRLRGSD